MRTQCVLGQRLETRLYIHLPCDRTPIEGRSILRLRVAKLSSQPGLPGAFSLERR